MEPVIYPRVDFDSGWAEADPAGHHVRVGNRYVWSLIQVTMPGARSQPALHMTIDSSTGAPRCVALDLVAHADGREILPSDLRAVELEGWISSIVALTSDEVVYSGPSSDGSVPYVVNTVIRVPDTSTPDFQDALGTMQRARLRERRRGGDDQLRQIAATYMQNPDKPALAVQRAFNMSPRTAFRYIRDARANGLIPPRKSKSEGDTNG